MLLSAAIVAPAFLVALSMREPPLPKGEVRLTYGALLRESARTATRLPPVRTMLILSSLLAGITFAPQLFMQPFLTGHGIDVAFVGFLQTPVRVMGIAGALIAYSATTRLGTRGAFLTAPLILVAAYVMLGAWDSVYAFAAFPLVAFVNALLLPTATDYLNRRIPNNQRATVLSLRTMLVSLWAALLTPAMGVAADALSLRAAFWISAAVVAFAIPVALALWLRADRNESEAATAMAAKPGASGRDVNGQQE